MGDELLLNQWKRLVSSEHHPWMLRSKGGVEDNVLDLDNPFGRLIYLLVSFKEDAISVCKIKSIREGGRLGIHFDLLDD